MNFGSILRGVYHAITPWHDSGAVFNRSSYQPQRKRRPEDTGYQAPTPQPVQNNQPQVRAQRPENFFQGLNQNLRLPGSPNPNVQVPGALAPHHVSLLNHIGNALKTAGQTVVGSVANVPEVGLAATRVGTGIVQGAAHIPSLVTHAATYVPRKIAGNDSPVNRALSGVNRTVDTATAAVDRPFNYVNRGLDIAAKGYAKHVPMASAGAKVYRTEQIPLNVLAGLLTLGGSNAAEAGQAGRLTRFFDRPLTSNPNNLISRTGRAVNKGAPVARGVMTPIKTARTGARSGMTRLINGRTIPTAERGAVDAGEAGNILTEAQVQDLIQPPTQIPVTQRGGGNVPIPVNTPRPGGIIREVGGDATRPHTMPTSEEIARRRFTNQTPGRPDTNIEGVTSRAPEKPFTLTPEAVATGQEKIVQDYADMLRGMGEGNGVDVNRVTGTRTSNNYRPGMGKGRISKAKWRDEARSQLESGKADSAVQKAFNDAADPEVQALLSKGEQTPPIEGSPIAVKQVTGIPVTDQTVVPQNLPETPGTVRPTTQTSPMNAKSEAVAAQTPVVLPKQTQAILDNPKQFNKRQVAAARNQRKLAKQLAKTQDETQSILSNAPKRKARTDESTPGFVPTGELRRGENGNITEVAHGSTEAAQAASDTATMSAGEVVNRATQDIAQNGVVSPESVRNLQSMIESGRFTRTSPEYKAMAKTLYGAGSDYGRGLSLFNPTLRRTATGDQLTNRFVSKLYGVTEDTSRLTDSDVAAVERAANGFTDARDAANQALDRYNATKAPEDFNAWKQARQAADDAEKQSLITEYKVANRVLKGNKDPVALKAVQEAEKKAGVYQMDWIDASMLSGTGTFTRNYVNTSLVRAENRLFGGRAYSSRGAKLGNKVGNRSLASDFKARNELDQNKVSKVVKQWSTTGNTFGEGNIRAVGSARAYKYYADQLKAKGVSGDQLKHDTEVMLHTDPDGMAQHYQEWSLRENALSSMYHSKKIEQSMVDAIAGHGGGKLTQTAAKALVRLTVGFPTVIGRSLLGGAKRATVGIPELMSAGVKFAKGDTQAAKDLLYNAKIHAGSGASLYGLGIVLAKSGHITPSYPTDPAEQARWKAEGKQPNSIKIGGQWFNIPGYFGALALPLVIPANVMNKSSAKDIAKGIIDGVQDLSPTAGIQNFIDGMEGRGGKQWVKNEISSLTRAVTPVGSLLNEIAKMTDPEKNDTTTKDAIGNLLDAIAGGIPGVNNMVNKIPATDANGNVLRNPNPVATAFGAQGSVQGQGEQDTQQAQDTANQAYNQLKQSGIIGNKDLMSLVDPKIQAQIARGDNLTPEQIQSVQKAVVKGVPDTGEDTAYLEKGQYDTNLAVLQVKRNLMAADPTTKPSDLSKMDTNIRRSQVYRDKKIPYDLVTSYKSTTLSEWRHMGDPQDDAYDPKMYQTLWNIDQTLAKADASYAKEDPAKQKFSAKKPVTGRGRGAGSRSIDTSFGTLKDGIFAPKVQQYDTIDAKSGVIPHISVVRPNIVHKISSSG